MTSSIKNTFNIDSNWKKMAIPLALVAGLGLAGCQDDAKVASYNLSKAADNFEINRRIPFFNAMTGEYLLVAEGRCSIEDEGKQLEVVCKTGPDEYKKHFLGRTELVTYFAEQLDPVDVNVYHHRITYKPQSILPDIDFRGDAGQMLEAVTPGANEGPQLRQ